MFYFRFERFYAVFDFRYFARSTFTRNFNSHSWRVYSRRVVCSLHVRAWLTTLSSLLKQNDTSLSFLQVVVIVVEVAMEEEEEGMVEETAIVEAAIMVVVVEVMEEGKATKKVMCST